MCSEVIHAITDNLVFVDRNKLSVVFFVDDFSISPVGIAEFTALPTGLFCF